MKVRSKAGLRGGWAVLALMVVALQACTAETEGPQPGQPPTTAPAVGSETSLAAAPPPPAAGPDEAQAAARPSPMDRPPVSYLEEVIPPCTPIEGSEEETCILGFPPDSIGQIRGATNTDTISVSSNSSGGIDIKFVEEAHGDYFYEREELSPTVSQIVVGESRLVSYPHLVIRGTIRPHTTRCEKYPMRIYKWLDYLCFVDVRINEYIIGKGPPDLTVAVYEESVGIQPKNNWELLPNEWLDERFDYPAIRTAEAYEGREMIILLTVPYASSVETFSVAGIYFVIKPEDRPIFVTPLYVDGLDLHTVDHGSDLDDLAQHYREAAKRRNELSEEPYIKELYLPPMLVEDANYLQDIYQIWVAEYEEDGSTVMDYLVLPPPPPSAVLQP